MLELLISASSMSQAVVFDPFAGSGTTPVAARSRGRRHLGVDIVREYAESAVWRSNPEHPPLLTPDHIRIA